MRARAPASSANLGPGFDTLALALALYTEVEVVPAGCLEVTSSGEGSELPADGTHLAARVASAVVGHDRLAIGVRSSIPVGRGLGSSAALAVAAAAAAGASDPLAVAARFEGHPENAAASVLGGLVTATTVAGLPVAHRLPLDPALAFVLVIPGRRLATTEARAALPGTVPHADATFNLGRLGLLVAGLADADLLRPEATEDRLHQHQRGALFPEAADVMAGLIAAGARASCWSGAGPTVLALCRVDEVTAVLDAAPALLASIGLEATAVRIEADRRGVVVTP